MKLNFKFSALAAFCLCFLINNQAFASRLPDDTWEFIKKELPNATQRFDSVIILDANTMYVPLYPAEKATVDNIKIDYTYPNNQTLKQKPEVVILNNNYVLMKIFKDKKGNFTITKNENLPSEVKLGVMPQDMLVPTGFKIPESLKIIMGDLLIPNRGDNLLITTSDATLSDDEETADIVPMVEFKDTKTFIANNKTKFVLVYDKGGAAPLYEIKLSGLPNKIIASPKTKFALTMYFGNKTAEIIDLVNERVLTKIDFEDIPTDADIDIVNQIAYVTSARANSIYMVDLNNASLAKTIKSDRAPNKISVSGQDNVLVFNDKNNENIYIMDLKSGTYSIKKIANVKNLSKLLIKNGKIIALSRTLNKGYIYKLNSFESENPAELIAELDLAEKPTDVLVYKDKAFILCSKENILNVYDFAQNKMLEPIALDKNGFYSKITLIPNKSNAVVTGINTKKMIIVDLENNKTEKKAKSEIDIADIVILDKNPPIKPAVDIKEQKEEPTEETVLEPITDSEKEPVQEPVDKNVEQEKVQEAI